MTRYTATEARRKIFRLLDAAERGEKVVVERRGVRFLIERAEPAPRDTAPPPPIAVEDEAILEGEWTWVGDENGDLGFSPRGPGE